MYNSLKAFSKEFHLYIFAFDDLTFESLIKMSLEKVTVISLDEFEYPELLNIKAKRTKAEYCWTCTPSTINHVFQNYRVSDCTYIDSDLIFYSDPSVLIEEMVDHNKNVLITEHRYSPLAKIYEEKRSGRFCVQFVTFSNEVNSLKILDKWRLQCIDWCYSRHEEGKFGDQKYLDEWPLVYDNIHILKHQGGGLAPWNLLQYRFKKDQISVEGILKKTSLEFIVVFFHFQYVKFLEYGFYDVGWYFIPSSVKKMFYIPYLIEIEAIENRLKKLNSNYQTCFTRFRKDNLKNFFKTIFKKTSGYNILKTNNNGFPS